MGKKGKRISRREKRFRAEQQDGANTSEIATSSSGEVPANSARAVNCKACLHPEESSTREERLSVQEIVNTVQANATIAGVEQSYILLYELLSYRDPPIHEIISERLDLVLLEGLKSTDQSIQNYAAQALFVLVKHMKEEQFDLLVLIGLKDAVASVMNNGPYSVIEKVIETCAQVVTTSPDLRDDIGAWLCLNIVDFMSPAHPYEITVEISRAVTSFSRDVCHYKPVPEFILKCLAGTARFLLHYQDWRARANGLSIITDVARSKHFIEIGNSYARKILRFLTSALDVEATSGFFAIGHFIKQRSKNTSKLLKMRVIEKIAHFLARHTTPEITYEVCPIIQSLLSKKYIRYIESTVETGLVLLLLKLLDDGAPNYKDEACTTLRSLNEIWRPRHAVRLVDPQHIRIMCNILKSSNTTHISCIIALMHSAMEACFALKDDVKTKEAKELLKEFGADNYVQKFVDSVRKDISMKKLAMKLHTLYLNDLEPDSRQNHAGIEKASHAQNSGSAGTEICASSSC
ncbi:unnamed protein product [Litomosoides sigmodontis]|uniref:Condensin complex subunit 1 C-terminal domain-containing protein n=1 Tax=Litomosoides sigmodontis TaxID=42156 RepID=A0A3P6SYF0_LITSI|nr:unnamed protein product [Litomosoides sigmodontis]